MKKTLIAMAVLAASGASFAQSTVTLFGVVDAAYSGGNGSVSNKAQLSNSGNASSRLGFKGTEDIGGGLKASFHLEAALANDNGAGGATNTNNQSSGGALANTNGGQGLTFARRSTVSLEGGFGELRLGRDYTPHFWNHTVYDPFGTNGVGTTRTQGSATLGGLTQTRASNTVGYFLPGNLGGFFGQVQVYMGENNSGAANSDDGNGASLRLGYAAGPVSVALASGETKYAAGNLTSTNLGGSYDMGAAKLALELSRDSVSGGLTGKGYMLGVSAPVGSGVVKASYSAYETDAATTPTQKMIAVGYQHNLSKRTAAYVTLASLANSGGAAFGLNGAVTAADSTSTGYDIGIRHSF